MSTIMTPNVSVCGACPTCCSKTLRKRIPERIPVCLDWAHRLECSGIWTLKSVRHVIKHKDGSQLAIPAHDPSRAYATGAQVSVGAAIYEAKSDVLVGGNAPLAVGQTEWGLQPAPMTDLFIPHDTDNAPSEWVDRTNVQTTVLVEAGLDDTEYRVEALATFKNCDGKTATYWDCALVSVENCDM